MVIKAREGDREAFSALMKTYKDLSLSLAISIIKDKMKAEDIVQEAFIKVYHSIKEFRADSNFSTWLYRIVVNTSYNTLKKEKRYSDVEPIEEIQERDFDDKLFGKMKLNDQQRFINLALDKISADEALSLRLFYLCEMSVKEIEKITAHSKSKIKVDLHRGRGNLLFQLERLLGTELKNLI